MRAQTSDIDEAWQILRSVARPNDIVSRLVTWNGLLFEPGLRRMLVVFSNNGRPAPLCELATLNATELLTGERAVGSSR